MRFSSSCISSKWSLEKIYTQLNSESKCEAYKVSTIGKVTGEQVALFLHGERVAFCLRNLGVFIYMLAVNKVAPGERYLLCAFIKR